MAPGVAYPAARTDATTGPRAGAAGYVQYPVESSGFRRGRGPARGDVRGPHRSARPGPVRRTAPATPYPMYGDRVRARPVTGSWAGSSSSSGSVPRYSSMTRSCGGPVNGERTDNGAAVIRPAGHALPHRRKASVAGDRIGQSVGEREGVATRYGVEFRVRPVQVHHQPLGLAQRGELPESASSATSRGPIPAALPSSARRRTHLR